MENVANAEDSVVVGSGNINNEGDSFVAGYGNKNHALNSMTVGYENLNEDDADGSHVFGRKNTSDSFRATTVGSGNFVSGD